MKNELLKRIKYAARELKLKNFYRPDGSACPDFIEHRNAAPRLLIVLSGEKRELMGFQGKRERIILQPGDFYFIDSRLWEECNFSTVHDFLCIHPFNEKEVTKGDANISTFQPEGADFFMLFSA